ncbi:MAG: hypothetical protein ACRDX8_03990 [Acidimicrobiales bacterium]
MSRRGANKALAQPPLPTPPATQDLGRRTVRLSLPGRACALHLNPSDFGCRRLATELADIWVHLAQIGAGRPTSQASSIRSLLVSVDTQTGGQDLGLSDLSVEHLAAWETELLAHQQHTPTVTPYIKVVTLLALLRWLADQPDSRLSPEVRDRARRGTRLEPIHRPGPDEYSPQERRRLVQVAMEIVKSETTRLGAALDAGQLFAPTVDGLIACHVLLAAATGEPPETIRMLRVGDLVLDPVDPALKSLGPDALATAGHRVDEVRVTFTKNRAHTAYERSYRGWLARWAFPTTLRLTAPLRASSGLPDLFLGPGADCQPCHFEFNRTGHGLAAWMRRQGIADEVSTPYTFGRLRKSAVVGSVDKDPVGYRRDRANHRTDTLFAHYLTSERTRDRQGAKLTLRVKTLFEAAMTGGGTEGPTVIDDEALHLLAVGQEAPGLPADTAKRLVANELDGPLTACRDPLSSPHAPAGQVCPFSANGSCYRCPNALITKRHVPAILGLLEAIDPARAGDLVIWSQSWEDIYVFLTTVVLPALGVHPIDHRERTCPIDPGVRNQPRSVHAQP